MNHKNQRSILFATDSTENTEEHLSRDRFPFYRFTHCYLAKETLDVNPSAKFLGKSKKRG